MWFHSTVLIGMPASKVQQTNKGQFLVTIPGDIASECNLEKGDEFNWNPHAKNKEIITIKIYRSRKKQVKVSFAEIKKEFVEMGLNDADFNPEEVAERISQKVKLKMETKTGIKWNISYKIKSDHFLFDLTQKKDS